MRQLYFVIPAYNEEASIGDLIYRINEVCNKQKLAFIILIIDDGSQDRTALIVRNASNHLPIKLISNKQNSGLGYTIKRGLEYACSKCKSSDLIITLDADLTQDPAYIRHMLREVDKGADVVIASRYRKGSGTEGLAFHRHLLSIGASLFMLVLYPIKNVRDYSCGFRMYTSQTIQWAFKEYGDNFITEEGFACMVEIAARLRPCAAFREIPFVLRYDEKRKPSAMKIATTIKAYIRVIKRIKSSNAKYAGNAG